LNINLSPVSNRNSHFSIEKSETAITNFQNNGIYGSLNNPLGVPTDESTILYYADVEATIKFNVLSFFDVRNADATRYTYYNPNDVLWLKLLTTNNQFEWLLSGHHSYYFHYEEFMFDYMNIGLTGVDVDVSYTLDFGEKLLNMMIDLKILMLI